jgi:hypothetical protein
MPSRSANFLEMMRVRVHFGLLLALLGSCWPTRQRFQRSTRAATAGFAGNGGGHAALRAGSDGCRRSLTWRPIWPAFRALVVSTETMSAENYRILGIVQSDAAWLNPAQEDNYYIAAAFCPGPARWPPRSTSCGRRQTLVLR